MTLDKFGFLISPQLNPLLEWSFKLKLCQVRTKGSVFDLKQKPLLTLLMEEIKGNDPDY